MSDRRREPWDYQDLHYFGRADVPVLDSGTVCACGRFAGDAFCCPRCADDLERCLGDVPALVEDLEVAAQRRARVTIAAPPRTVRRDSPHLLDAEPHWWRWPADAQDVPAAEAIRRRTASILASGRPDNPRAAQVLAQLHASLTGAILALLEPIGKTYDGDPSTVGMSRWLLATAASVPLSPAGPDIVHDIVGVHDQALRLIDNAAERTDWGPCECGSPVLIPHGLRYWRCSCDAWYDTEQLEADRAGRITAWAADKVLTISEIAAVTGAKPKTVRKRIDRAGLVPSGRVEVEGRTVAIYAMADYLAATRKGA
ncbi:hypothetical protein [Brooklawnia cerclae]|uniref:DNA-binding protein n=2 Tax=Brooklawnia cerclae TaxID=349934 RepID=A0ABX0SKQ5_9ACTN|nr:hypothetical protein [Brooklawnia cerclae]NIH57306.1 hypothetical protein [Brooklawnia cerclae]